MLRYFARGRDSFRWVGTTEAGKNLAVLLTIVQTCRACGIDPNQYIADVLVRFSHTRVAELNSLMPWTWNNAQPALPLAA